MKQEQLVLQIQNTVFSMELDDFYKEMFVHLKQTAALENNVRDCLL